MSEKEKLFAFPNLDIEFKTGPISEVDVDVIVNSTNGTMIHGSGTAEDISDASGRLTGEELEKYVSVVEQMPGVTGKVYREVWGLTQEGKHHQPTKLQLESAEFFLANNGVPISQGQVALTSSGNLSTRGGAKWIVHAVGMTYDYEVKKRDEKGRPPVIPARPIDISEAVLNSLNLIKEKNLGTSVAIPIMAVRKGGIAPEQSLQAIKSGLEEHLKESGNLQKVVIVGDNPKSANFIAANRLG